MNGPEHYRESEQLLVLATEVPGHADQFTAEAQVHATLALASASALGATTHKESFGVNAAEAWRKLLNE